MEPSPTTEEWKALFEAASEFKRLEPWMWMWDSDLFGVKNPETGEIGYCCIMGRLGEHFALAVYLGAAGLETYRGLQSGKVSGSFQVLATQKCLTASFEDRTMLSDEDLQLIKKLGLAFRGKNAWPQFRDYTPGYMPWYLTGEQARFLTLALQQAVEVSLQMRDDLEALDSPADDMCMVRVLQKDEKERGLEWVNEWIAFPVSAPARVEVREVSIPDERLRTLAAFQHKGTWEVGFFFMPTPVKDKEERPYIPYVVLWVDHTTGIIFHAEMTKAEEYEGTLVKESLRAMEALKRVPEKILVGKEREEVARVVEGIASQLGIKVVRVRRLREVERARKGMISHFSVR